MTDKFKKRVREHAKKHGMSYQAALQQLTNQTPVPDSGIVATATFYTGKTGQLRMRESAGAWVPVSREDMEILRRASLVTLETPQAETVVVKDREGERTHALLWKFPPPDGDQYATESSTEALQAWIDYAKGLETQVEQLQVQLAGCSVAAFGHGRGSNDAHPGDYGHSVAYDDVKHLRQRHEAAIGLIGVLWKLLDDIDTMSDAAKSDDIAYRRGVERIQKRRWDTGVVSDGYRIFLRDWPEKREKTKWLDPYDPEHPDWGPAVLDGVGPEIFADAPEKPMPKPEGSGV